MTHLRKMMLEELQRRNYSQQTTKAYLRTVRSSPGIFTALPRNSGPSISASFRLTCLP